MSKFAIASIVIIVVAASAASGYLAARAQTPASIGGIADIHCDDSKGVCEARLLVNHGKDLPILVSGDIRKIPLCVVGEKPDSAIAVPTCDDLAKAQAEEKAKQEAQQTEGEP